MPWHDLLRSADAGGLSDGSYHYGRAGAALHPSSAIDMALWDLARAARGAADLRAAGGAARWTASRVYASEVMPETPGEAAALAQLPRMTPATAVQARMGTARAATSTATRR